MDVFHELIKFIKDEFTCCGRNRYLDHVIEDLEVELAALEEEIAALRANQRRLIITIGPPIPKQK